MEQEINKNLNLDFENKVKQKNKKTLLYFFMRLGIVLVTVVGCLVYLLTPLSSISNCSIKGNIYLEKEDIYSLMNCDNPSSTSIYSIDEAKIEELLNAYPVISDADVSLTPFSFDVSFVESAPSAKYLDTLYCSDGKKFTSEELANPLIQDYLDKTNIFSAEFINKPNEGIYFKDFLYIVTNVNKGNKVIDYVDTSSEKESLFLYYKESGNSYYYRVKLIYNPQYSIDTYLKVLSFNQSMVDGLKKNIEKNSKELVEEENISYYSFRIEIEDENKYGIY